ncbi:DUF3047 domain-containing protein [Ideonella paludis]|uniref:DUF3047 domain-containing protein n=1 Tax=Ideonella paludis TaxID=1233411 RepID=A0ABS5E1Z2_9BURK|nr:DUF3047 domain-containing protein [Ideonella paludis]MBQ0937433.1 DUF3047 domain-containing protein [Ideonella paludis]
MLVSVFAMTLVACTHAPPSLPVKAADSPWEEVRFPGKRVTTYDPITQGRFVGWQASAQGSASMLRRRLHVPQGVEPTLRFAWKTNALIPDAVVGVVDKDDAVTSVVVAFDGDHQSLSLKNQMLFDLAEMVTGERPPYASLIYVWGHDQATIESVVNSPRTDRIRKIVLEAGPAHLGQWREYERNVIADFKRAFGEEPGPIIALGIMTDADNTGGRAQAWYANVDLTTSR